MKKTISEFVIPFIGLKQGSHEFNFKIQKSFFDAFENTLINDSDLDVKLILEKKETMMVANFDLSGDVTATCDRCDDPVSVPIDGRFRIVYKFGLEQSEDENLFVLHPEAYEINVQNQIYEFMVVLLPSRVTHEMEEDCNQEVMETYRKFIVNPGDEDEDEWFDENEEWDDEDWTDDDNEEEENDDSDGDEPDDDRPIDPRWAALKNLN